MYSTCEKWVADVGDDFRFTIKLYKDITHAEQLKYNATVIGVF